MRHLPLPAPTADCLERSNGGFVPDFSKSWSFVFKPIGGFVFQKALSFQLAISFAWPLARQLEPDLLPDGLRQGLQDGFVPHEDCPYLRKLGEFGFDVGEACVHARL